MNDHWIIKTLRTSQDKSIAKDITNDEKSKSRAIKN